MPKPKSNVSASATKTPLKYTAYTSPPPRVYTQTELIMGALDPGLCAMLNGTGGAWGDEVSDEEEIDPTWIEGARACQAERRAAEATVACNARAADLAKVSTPEWLANLQAPARKAFAKVLDVVGGQIWSCVHAEQRVLPVWRLLQRAQIRRNRACQEVLEADIDAMWAWVHAQPEYQAMTEEDVDDMANYWDSYWEEKYSTHLENTLPGALHLDADGNVAICRYFNTPGGCHREPGTGACPYKHIVGVAPEAEPCKFFNTPRGCKNGNACPFKHVHIAESEPSGSWRTQPSDAWGSVRCGSVSTVSSAEEGWTAATGQRRTTATGGGRPPLAQHQREPCRFFRSPRGCAKGATCPYAHA